jgi:methylenetetrahydrofolate--tRNA-(uracil-5-)-methyltransferase
MNANFGLLDPLDPPVRDKAERKQRLVQRALADIDRFADEIGVATVSNLQSGMWHAE